MPPASILKRTAATTLSILALWIAFYASFTLFHPALLDDADSVHAEVAREMLLRHDWVTLYANGIRYLEKAPLLYWSMATCMGAAQLLGQRSPQALAVAARVPMALTVLALAFAVEGFARRAFRSSRAGLYAALILLSSPGIFLFTRLTLPDAMLCLWLTLAMLCFWMTEDRPATNTRVPHPSRGDGWDVRVPRRLCFAFASCCALGVLTKGLIGLVFPIAIITIYLLLTRGFLGTIRRIGQLHPITSTAVFLLIAAPWHILIALANPTQGHPGGLSFAGGHWQVPLPTDGNVHGWAWFYFVNEQVLRYLNLRVPRDYDTVPLWLFWGLCLVWLMPWSAFVFRSIIRPLFGGVYCFKNRRIFPRRSAFANPGTFFLIWAFFVLLFFSFSTRQEYYVLPALPALCVLIAARISSSKHLTPFDNWTGHDRPKDFNLRRVDIDRGTAVLLVLGTTFAVAALYFILRTRTPAPTVDLATLLQQNPGDYAMSMGHFLDLNAQALGLFRLPLALAAASLFLGPLASFILRKRAQPHHATLALAAGAFGFLLAAHVGLQTFAPVLSSQELAAAIAPQLRAGDLIVIHQEYEYGSTLGFYLQRPSYSHYTEPAYPGGIAHWNPWLRAVNPIHILTDASYNGTPNYGRSSNLWYGSFFPDAPQIFETTQSLAQKWAGPQRIFLWQDLANQPSPLPAELTPIYVIAKSGGKEVVSNQPNP